MANPLCQGQEKFRMRVSEIRIGDPSLGLSCIAATGTAVSLFEPIFGNFCRWRVNPVAWAISVNWRQCEFKNQC